LIESYDPFPDRPSHEEWRQVLYTACHTMDSDIYNLFLALRHKGVAIKKEFKQEGRNRLKVYSIYRGEVSQDEFRGIIVPQYLEPNREKIKAVLKLASFEGEFIDNSDPQLHGINFDINQPGNKGVVADAVKKYLPRIIEARYNNYTQGNRFKDGREVWVVCDREPGSDRTEITWEEFYVLCWLQDIGKLAPGPEGMAGAVRWREV